jgi:hypothetical protein
MLAEMSPWSITKHVIRQHLVEVVKATRAGHAVHRVVDRFVVPVLEPAFVELVKDFLLLDFPLGIVILGGNEDLGEVVS